MTLCIYNDAFSLRDEMGNCSNIEIEIVIMDKLPFFIHIKEEDKNILDKEMKRLCYIKRRFLSLFKSFMLISRRVTKDKSHNRFRHLNVRIAKNNVAYPLLKDIFSVLGSSRCEVLSVLDLKAAFHSLRL